MLPLARVLMNPLRLIEMFEVKENPSNESFHFQMVRDGKVVLKSGAFTDARSAFKVMEETKAMYARGGLGFKVFPSDKGYYLVLMTMSYLEIARSTYFDHKTDCLNVAREIITLTNQDGLIRIIEDR